ncbi:MAG: Rha family transcriptional regulator [Glutamicibacter sp.]|uniref:hypothetical protein n=1 Tax=Glutamicibacter sp. TaxID=1931995 RepID=UPI002FC676EC
MNGLSKSGPSVTSREIAELVESRHDDVKRSIERLVVRGVITSPPMAEKPTAGRPVAEYIFTGEQGKRDSIVVVAQLSPEFTARLVDRWLELEHRAIPSSVEDGCTLIESVTRTLHLPPSESLGMYHKLADKTGHKDLLPAYTVDAIERGGGSSQPTASLKSLLLEHKTGLSAMKVYPLLEKAGLAEHLSRPSSKGVKKFWCLTEAGQLFGKNLTSPANNRETQPHFYTSEFPQLLQVIGLSGLLEAA